MTHWTLYHSSTSRGLGGTATAWRLWRWHQRKSCFSWCAPLIFSQSWGSTEKSQSICYLVLYCAGTSFHWNYQAKQTCDFETKIWFSDFRRNLGFAFFCRQLSTALELYARIGCPNCEWIWFSRLIVRNRSPAQVRQFLWDWARFSSCA